MSLAGAVALLLWGVRMVQTGMQRALGVRLRMVLAHAVGRRISAFLAGAGVTMLLQSSTATGLIVSGFAAEGLIGLASGLAVMLGANVGTTLIVQVLAFDVAAFAPLPILVGFLMFRRAEASVKDFGRVFIGLGLLLLALHQFLSLLAPLAASPLVRTFLAALAPHIIFVVLIGAVLTWAAHSSVAVVLLASSLCASGVLPLPAALALTLGANLGTAVNPVLEASAPDAAARRLPLGNLLNRVVGVLAVLAIYPFVTPFIVRIDAAPVRAVANFHTLFNLALAVVFFPLLTPYAKLLERWLPASPSAASPDAPRYLQPVEGDITVGLALGGATREALRLADVLEEMISGLRDALARPAHETIERTRQLDDRLDRLSRAIKENLLAIDVDHLDGETEPRLARILTFAINLEQAGDLIDRGLLGIASRRMKRGVMFSEEGLADLTAQIDALLQTLQACVSVFLSGDAQAARDLAKRKQDFRRLDETATTAHFSRLRSGSIETLETSALHLDALRDLKRVAGHLVEAAAYPILKERGDLLPTRLRAVP